MRFSLRTLLLLFPALIVSYGLAYGWAATGRYWGWHHPPWLNQIQPMKFAQEDLQKNGVAISVSEVNRWFRGTPFKNTAKERHWQSMFYDSKSDGWQQPLVCVALDDRDVPDPLIESAKRVGFYSCGEDGVSHSHGNDPDDLNSWSSTTEYYQELTRKRYQDHLRTQALWRTPWAFGFVLILWSGFRWLKRWLASDTVDIEKIIESI